MRFVVGYKAYATNPKRVGIIISTYIRCLYIRSGKLRQKRISRGREGRKKSESGKTFYSDVRVNIEQYYTEHGRRSAFNAYAFNEGIFVGDVWIRLNGER